MIRTSPERPGPDRAGPDRPGPDRIPPRAVRPTRAGGRAAHGRPLARRARALTVALAVGVAVAGCTQIPQSSTVRSAAPLGDSRAQPDAPLFRPPGPAEGASAEEVIRGFVLAGTGPQDDYAIARSHLSGAEATEWNPGRRTVVYAAEPTITPAAGPGTYQIQVEVESEVDEFGLRTVAAPGTTQAWKVTVAESEEGVRITSVDDGTLLSASQFSQLYAPHELIYYDPTMTYAVPDVRWFVNRGTTVSAATRALLHGPAPYLSGAVVTAFPLRSGADLTGPGVPVDGDGVARVDLTEGTLEGADAEARHRMQEQLTLTLTGLSTVERVEVSVESAPLSAGGTDGEFPPIEPVPAAESVQVGVDPGLGGLAFFHGLSVTPVGGMPDVVDLAPVDPAMSRDRTRFAFLTRDRTSLYVASSVGGLKEVLAGARLTAPSLDALGWAWTVDTGGASRIHASPVSREGGETPRVVTAPWLRPGEQIIALKISRDGARAALVVDDGESRTVRVAGVVRGSDGVPASLTEPVLLPGRTAVDEVEWAGDAALIVTGHADEPTERIVPEVVSLDGTARELNPLTGLIGVSAGDDGVLYAETGDTVFLLVGSSWRAQELTRPVRDLAFPG